jgi:Protein of unknown function (DUF1449)
MLGFTDHLLLPEVRPFAIAAMMIIIVGGVELISMAVGVSMSELVGNAIDIGHDSDNAFINAVAWLNVGGVPLLVFIVVILGMFSITGFLIQDIARAVAGPLPLIAAVPLACAASVPLVRGTTRLVSRIIPKDESYAVELSDLVGRVGKVSVGPLDQGLPGRVRVKDAHGNWHVVTASAAPNSPPLAQGAAVLLVDRSAGHFIAIAAPDESGALRHP